MVPLRLGPIKPMIIIIIVSYLKYINTLFNCMSLFNSMANYNICFSLCSRHLEVIGTGKNGAWKKESLVPYVLSSAHYSRAPATQVTTQVTLLSSLNWCFNHTLCTTKECLLNDCMQPTFWKYGLYFPE